MGLLLTPRTCHLLPLHVRPFIRWDFAMASQSLYRKWRSQTFADVVGQEATVRTLLNAVRDGRLAHAYLFCGPRGTGKTSTARLLAKAINCATPHDGEPCNECLSCQEITAGRSPDVIEIDAASNTGVDNIRDLRENVNLLGTGGRFKLYIIDEVHMLSTQAFNALLKTLEEPPPHVIFVLATTEAQKVLPTVVSRCQRFDFRRISARDIVARLHHVAAGEGLELEPAAADLLARAAQGGLRDALSLLDQAVAYCGMAIDLERTRTMLGLADPGTVRGLIVAVAEQRAADALHSLNELVVTGADLRQVQQQLAEEWRALLLARAGADVAQVMDRTPDEARELAALANRFALDEVMACARVFARTETPARGLPVPQLAVELALLECLAIRRQGGAVATPSAGGAPRTQVETHSETRAPGAVPLPATAMPPPSAPPAPRPVAPPASPRAQSSNPRADEMKRDAATPLPPPAAEPTASADELEAADLNAGAARDAPLDTALDETGEPDAAAPRPERSDAAGVRAAQDWLAIARRDWEVVKKVCKQKSYRIAALLSHARPTAVEQGNPPLLVVEVQYQFHLDKLRVPENRAVVEWALAQVLDAPVGLRLVLTSGGASPKQPSGGTTPAQGQRAGGSGTAHGASAAREPSPASRPEPRHEPSPESSEMVRGARHDGQNGRQIQNGHGGIPGPMAGLSPTREASGASPAAESGGVPPTNGRLPHTTPAEPASGAHERKPGRPSRKDQKQAELDAAARADAVVQEIQRTLGAELIEVQPLDDAEDDTD
jgi:DNA polymerase-3 subunit gamma/tau